MGGWKHVRTSDINQSPNGIMTVHPNALRRALGTRLHYHVKGDHDAGMFMSIYPHDHKKAGEGGNTWCEVTVDEDFFERPKDYTLKLKYHSEVENTTIVTVRPFVHKRKYSEDDLLAPPLELKLPSTEKEWIDMAEAVPLTGIKLGGLRQQIIVRFAFHQPAGCSIENFQFIPVKAESTDQHSALWFQSWFEELKDKIVGDGKILPALELEADALVQLAEVSKQSKEAAYAQDHTKSSQEAVNEAEQNTNNVLTESIGKIQSTLDNLETELDGVVLEDNLELMQCLAVAQATPLRLADYCALGEAQTNRLMHFLKEDTAMLKDMIVHGFPKRGLVGHALDNLAGIQDKQQTDKAVLPRLALAVAMEMAYPICEMDTEIEIDPVQRYLCYEKLYLEGLLDPAFEHFTIWELRMAVSTPASNAEIVWCNKLVTNFRPDYVYDRVTNKLQGESDYVKPNFPEGRVMYHHIFTHGGRCGARAKIARLLLHAFGIPCWGLIVPGHATYDHWTTKAWSRHYTAGVWEGRRAFDFYHEVTTRKVLGNDDNFKKINFLDCMATMAGEVPGDSHPTPECPWHSLGTFMRKHLANKQDEPLAIVPDEVEVPSILTAKSKEELPESENISVVDGGTIVVPSFSRKSDEKSIFMKSFLGGMQVYVREGSWKLVFAIPSDLLTDGSTTYKLTLRLVSIHNVDLAPVIVSINNSNEYKVAVPYTSGTWMETEAVEVELAGGDKDATIEFSRTMPYQALSLKDFKLTPV